VLPPVVAPDSDFEQERSRAETVLRVIGLVMGVIFVGGLVYLVYLR
jgi:hypothetical protein